MQIENCGADSEMCSENTRFDTAVKLNASAMIWPQDLSNFFHVGRASCVVCAHCRLQHVDSYANQHFLSFVAFVGLVSRCEQFMSLVVLLFCPRMLGMPQNVTKLSRHVAPDKILPVSQSGRSGRSGKFLRRVFQMPFVTVQNVQTM